MNNIGFELASNDNPRTVQDVVGNAQEARVLYLDLMKPAC